MFDSTRLAGERSCASWMEALKFEQEAYSCTNKALPGENRTSLAWREVFALTNKSVLDCI